MRFAICGLPGAGKSTLMQALSSRRIDNKEGPSQIYKIPVSDARLDALSILCNINRKIYANIFFLNPFISKNEINIYSDKIPNELQKCEGLIEVVRNFKSELLGEPQPLIDHKEWMKKLILNDFNIVKNRLERISLDRQHGRKFSKEELMLCEEVMNTLGQGVPLNKNDKLAFHPKLKGYNFISNKTLLIILNSVGTDVKIPDFEENGVPVLVVVASIEAELAEMNKNEREEIISAFNLDGNSLDRLIQVLYKIHKLVIFFTIGKNEVRAWIISQNSSIDVAAGFIHSNFQKGFIRAEVIKYEDLFRLKSVNAVKKAGLIKIVKKDYLVSDGDIIHILFKN